MHLRRVDLPEPLRPMIPKVSPGVDLELEVSQGPEVLKGTWPACSIRSFKEVYFSL